MSTAIRTRRHQVPPAPVAVTSDGLRRSQLATEQMIANAAGVLTFNTRSGPVTLNSADVATALGYIPAARYTVSSTAVGYTETATTGEKLVKVTATGRTIVLPTAVGNTAKLHFKLMVAGSVILDGAGTETIDTALTATISTQYQTLTLVSDNANWLVI